MKNKDKFINILEPMIEYAQEIDKVQKAKSLSQGKASKAVGESWLVFNLKKLKELVDEEQ